MSDQKKQIEEMAKDVTGSIVWCSLEDDFLTVDGFRTDEALYEEGYRKQVEGEWELHGNDDELGSSFFCNVCWNFAVDEDEFYRPSVGGYKMYRFCPSCGAKMKGGESDVLD